MSLNVIRILCHPYVIRMYYSYVIRVSLVCSFTMNHLEFLKLDLLFGAQNDGGIVVKDIM